MSCNNIKDISVDMCNKICSDNIPASNTDQLTSCNTKCYDKIIGELNPLDITNNFIFLKSADVAGDALEIAAGESQQLYEQKKEMMNTLITNMEAEIQVKNSDCEIKIGIEWTKIINGDKKNEFIDIDYITKFKKYSAFGLKWQNVGNTEPDNRYIKLVDNTKAFNYLRDILINPDTPKDAKNNILLNKKQLIDNNLFPDDNTKTLKIYPNSYILLSDNSYCKVSSYDDIDSVFKQQYFNLRNDKIDLSFSDKFDETSFNDLTMDDFIMNDSGDIYMPVVGCSELSNQSCLDIEDVLSTNKNCMVDNKNNRYIKRKDTIPYLFHDNNGSPCIDKDKYKIAGIKALDFGNKNELFDIINLVSQDPLITYELNEMMGKYDPERYEKIKTRINQILTDDYSQYFLTNDFLNLFDNNIKYWIKLDDKVFKTRDYRYYDGPSGIYDMRNPSINNRYDEIAKILSNSIQKISYSNFIELSDDDVEAMRTLFKQEKISKKMELEDILQIYDYFNVIDADGNSNNIILYKPLFEHYTIRDDLYYDSHLYKDESLNDWVSVSGIDFYSDLENGQKKIESPIIGTYGKIGYDLGLYNNVILSEDYITKTDCEEIQLNVLNTSNTNFLTENIENRHNLDNYKLNENDFDDLNTTFNEYNTNIDNLNKCLENSKTMIDLDTYTKTKEYDNINKNIQNNAEINNKYNIYLSKVNKYDGHDTSCKLLSEYNNKDTCGITGETNQICLSDDYVSDTEYDTTLLSKKDSLKSYIFKRQKDYYVGKNTLINIPKIWQTTTEYPNIGLEFVNAYLTSLLDNKFVSINGIITLTDDELDELSDEKFISQLTDDQLIDGKLNIDNNTFVKSLTQNHYYTVNLQQTNCNQPNDYLLQNSENICGEDKKCAYENNYNTSITEINKYDDNLCTNKYNYLEQCYNEEPEFDMGKKIDYSVCKDDIKSSPQIIDCCPVREDGTRDPVCLKNPQCDEGSYITYKIKDGKYTCEKVCGNCVPNTTLNINDGKCQANVGYYYDISDYDELESTNPPVPEKCESGYYIDTIGAKSISECNICDSECDDQHYETVACTYSKNRVCTILPNNSTKSEDGADFVCDENYFKRGNQCVKCPNETTSIQGSTSVSNCIANPGYYFNPKTYVDDENIAIPTDANRCDWGKYCPPGAIAETKCPDNTTSLVASGDISSCYARPGYYYNNTIHSEGQICNKGFYCPGGDGQGGDEGSIQVPCPANTYNPLTEQINENSCLKCAYETSSTLGSSECSACPAISSQPASKSAIRKYKYYNYKTPGCAKETEITRDCSTQQLAGEELLNDDNCPQFVNVEKNGRTINKRQFYGYNGLIERDDITGKPKLYLKDQDYDSVIQEDIRDKLSTYDFQSGGFVYELGSEVDHKCARSCESCLPDQIYSAFLSSCSKCGNNQVADDTGLECVDCNKRDANTIYDTTLRDCVRCNDYLLPDFDSNTCVKPLPGYYVECDDVACVSKKADKNKIVLGQINNTDWTDTIKSIIFDYEDTPVSNDITQKINIFFKNVPIDESSTESPIDETSNEKTDIILNLTTRQDIQNNKYYKDISKNIIIFDYIPSTNTENLLIKFLDSIYISSNTEVTSLPDKLILQSDTDSYYLLTHRMKLDINDRYYKAEVWGKQIEDVKRIPGDDGYYSKESNSLGSFLIFDINLNITNEQYTCPENTYHDDGTSKQANGQIRGTNRNICKFYDTGYYRDTREGFTDDDTSSLSSATTVEELFTNYENFDIKMQTTCFNNFTPANRDTIDISESKLGADSGGKYSGCIYKCKTEGHYYNEGTPGEADNRCEQCPIGYKCDDFQNRTACNGTNEYQNELGSTSCKTIPTGATAIFDSEEKTHIGFTVPIGKQYNKNNNTITDCSKNTYKNNESIINNINTEKNIVCTPCPSNTTTKELLGRTELKHCIPDFGYTFMEDNTVTTLIGYEDTQGSLKCASSYYLGDFAGNCDETNSNECTQCEGDNDKACIECPPGYNCAGGSVDCKIDPAIPIIKDGNIDIDPLDGNPIYTIDSCWPGMKLINGGECQPCDYTSSGLESNKYCLDGTVQDYNTKPSAEAIKLKNNDKYTPAVYITAVDNENYNINSIAKDSSDAKNIIFEFKNNNIPANIENYEDYDIDYLKDEVDNFGIPLYLYEYASGEKDTINNIIVDATNVTQNSLATIPGNTINLANEGYLTNEVSMNLRNASIMIKNKIKNNDLKFTGIEKNQLIDIIKQYKKDKDGEIIDEDMNLSYVYDLQYYDGTQYKIYTYVYRILPYPSQCPEGYETTTGLINSCQLCPQGTYKVDSSATRCLPATGDNYVGVHDLIPSNSATGLGGIKVSTIPPNSSGLEMLTTNGGNYGYKLKTGYNYIAATTSDPFRNEACGTGFNEEKILVDNFNDNTNLDDLCGSCPSVASYTLKEQIGLVETQSDSTTFSSNNDSCVIKVCDTNYINKNDDSTEFCKLRNCQQGYYFDNSTKDKYNQGTCKECPKGHYCGGTTTVTPDHTKTPDESSHPKTQCPVNTYNHILGKSLIDDCTSCPPNTSTNESLGVSSINGCISNSGYYFNPDNGETSATICPTNTSTNGLLGASSINGCISNSGYYFDPANGETSGTICPDGFYCPKGTLEPIQCPLKTTSSKGSSSYTQCRAEAGWFYDYDTADENTTANECPEKTYCEGENKNPDSCPDNTNTDDEKRKTSKADCKADAGHYYNYEDNSHITAQQCPVGTYNENTNSTTINSCLKCPENTYSSTLASITSTDCQRCPDYSSTTLDDNGNTIIPGNDGSGTVVTIDGKSSITDCKPYKMYQINNADNTQMELKSGHALQSGIYSCIPGYYFDNSTGECKQCRGGYYCEGGLASDVDGVAIELQCPQYSTSIIGSSSQDSCKAIAGYRYDIENEMFVKNEGVSINDINGEIVFKPDSDFVQCIPGYEGKTEEGTNVPEECQQCDETTYSADGNECLLCGTSDETELVLKDCEFDGTNIIKINKTYLRIESIIIESEGNDNILSYLTAPLNISVINLYEKYIVAQTNTYPSYDYLLSNTTDLYFIKIPMVYETTIPVTGTDNLHSKVTASHIIDNAIASGTSSYDNIITFIRTINDDTNILDLCYFPPNANGIEYDVFLLLPKCGCIPGTKLDGNSVCNPCIGNTFQPYKNQNTCYPIPANIGTDSYTITTTGQYNTGVNLNMGWVLTANELGESVKCAKDKYNDSTTDITNQIVTSSYTAGICNDCPVGSGTQDAIGSTDIANCTVKFGYTEKTLGTYEFDTGYEDVGSDNIIDCLAGYYFDGTSCVECPAGHYCEGGIATNDGATKTQCPMGTFNTFTGKTLLADCLLIDRDNDGRGYYGTELGISSSDDPSFEECREFTRIDETSAKNSIANCNAIERYKTTIDGTDYKVELQDQYKMNGPDNIICKPGSLKVDDTVDSLCKDPPSSFNYDTPTGFISGTSTSIETCRTQPSGSVELSKCDAYKNRITKNIDNLQEISPALVLGGAPLIRCVPGYLPKYFEYLEPTPGSDDLQFIDNITKIYLYEYISGDLEDWKSKSSEFGVDENFHLNTTPDLISKMNETLNNNLELPSTALNIIKNAIKEYHSIKVKGSDYKLQFYNDILVYKEGTGKIIRYVYGLLPECSACANGYTSNGYECSICPIGTKQITNTAQHRLCEPCNNRGTEYQDAEGQIVCKPLPSSTHADGFKAQHGNGGITNFNIMSGWKWSGSGNNISRCPNNQKTDDYKSGGKKKEDATGCRACPPNYKQHLNGHECEQCPPGQFYDSVGCKSCSVAMSAIESTGVHEWGIKPGSGHTGKAYCKANSCSTDYIKDAGLCTRAQCNAGQYYDGTRCVSCQVNYYCPSTPTDIDSQSNPPLPKRLQCPTNTVSPAGSTNGNQCVPKKGYQGPAGAPATVCGNGTYKLSPGAGDCTSCPQNTSHKLTGSYDIKNCVPNAGYSGPAGGTATPCGNGTYKLSSGAGAANPCISCPQNTSHKLMGSSDIKNCVPNAGYSGPKGGPAIACVEGSYKSSASAGTCTSCPNNTASPTQSTNVNQCKPKPGYYGDSGSAALGCPGVSNANDPSANNIITKEPKTGKEHCEYGACGSNKFRNSAGECKPFNSTSSCPPGKIFIEGNQIGTGKTYSAYSADIVSNYDNTGHIYGHDNMCLNSSVICSS